MKKFILFLLCTVFYITTSQEPVKKIILEQHTGAWCGWCVDGTVVMDKVLELYPDRVIGIKVHNGDSMAIPEQSVIASTLGLTGYPNATIDRRPYNGSTFIGRGEWQAACEALLNTSPKVDISLNYDINPETRELKGTVSATILETISKKLSFNMMICEDSVSGIGTGWDQSNYLSKRPGYEDNPYYNLPSKIVGYQHMKVVRKFLGGPWGVEGSFANGVEVGQTYTHEFSFTLPPNWDIDHIWTVGVVSVNEPDDKSYVNACYGTMGPPPEPVVEIVSDSKQTALVKTGDNITKTFTIKNISDQQDIFNINANTSDNFPKNWSFNLSTNQITLDPDQEGSFDVNATIGDDIGLGTIDLTISSTNSTKAPKGKVMVSLVSSNIENLEIINTSDSNHSVLKFIPDNSTYFQINDNDFNNIYDILSNVHNIIWNTGENSKILPVYSNAITTLIDKGANIYFIGYNVAIDLNKADILENLGIKYQGYSDEGYSEGLSAPYLATLIGIENDIFSNDFFNNKLPTFRNSKYYYTMEITDKTNAHPYIVFYNDQEIYYEDDDGNIQTKSVAGNDAAVGVYLVKNNSKIFIVGILPSDIWKASNKEKLFDKPIQWFNGILDTPNEDLEKSLSVIPNPVDYHCNIYYKSKQTFNSKISIINIIGEEIITFNHLITNGLNVIPVNTSNLSNGTYFITIKNGNLTKMKPILINK